MTTDNLYSEIIMKHQKRVISILLASVSLMFATATFARPVQATPEALRKQAPNVFVDCRFCDLDYIRTEITFVNYVRDRKEAQVHILITAQSTGSGGTEYTLAFLGQGEFAGVDDTLTYTSNSTNTGQEIRQGLVRVLKLGLMRYVAKSPIRDQITISFAEAKADNAKPAQVKDKWDYWVFSLNGNLFFNGERSFNSSSAYANLSASRVTPNWKIRASASGSRQSSRFSFGEETIKSSSQFKSVDGLAIKSLGGHWSVGSFLSAYSSSFENIHLAVVGGPAIEYDVFPYSESTRRQLRIQYRVGYHAFRYREETIYDKLREQVWSEQISAELDVKEKWGMISTSLRSSNYLNNFGRNRLQANGELSVRLLKGLSVNFFGGASRIRDQLSLPKGDASLEETLLRRRLLATSYSFYGSIGLSYTFGSIYSNVVNPRFGSGSGRIFR